MTTKEAVEHLSKALKEDAGYWISWKANIAMAFKDEYSRREKFLKDGMSNVDLHYIANQAAENFLKQLTHENKDEG